MSRLLSNIGGMEPNIDNRWRWTSRTVLVAVMVFFVWLRPLNSPWHPFIAGDGLGYYSYLPAVFIYHDGDFTFEWFNEVHNANYVYSAFENPEDNLLTTYNGRKINKYYQGLSFIWLPFFLPAHATAVLTGYNADGFSAPYQWWMGLASMFYLLLGLYYLIKLLRIFTGSDPVASFGAAAIFFGTHLCTYAVFSNTLSHSYSFTFVTLFIYFLARFSVKEIPQPRYLLLAVAALAITVAIRPLNGLVVLLTPAFVGFKELRRLAWHQGPVEILITIVTVGAVLWVTVINWRQTGHILAYNYGDESFDFTRPRFFDALFSYHIGLFVYAPLLLLALCGSFYLPGKSRWIFPLFFLGIIFLYSCWWFWPITRRASVDFYAIPASALCGLIIRVRRNLLWRTVITSGIVLSVLYFQLKSFQFRNGILDENATYGEIFWRHFFRIEKTNVYSIDPKTVLRSATIEPPQKEIMLDAANYIMTVIEAPFPAFFAEEGFRKVRFSFDANAGDSVSAVHVFMNFLDSAGKTIREVPFYINAEQIAHDKWDRREFGHEIADDEGITVGSVTHVRFVIWNVEAKGVLRVNHPKAEFLLTDRSFETIR